MFAREPSEEAWLNVCPHFRRVRWLGLENFILNAPFVGRTLETEMRSMPKLVWFQARHLFLGNNGKALGAVLGQAPQLQVLFADHIDRDGIQGFLQGLAAQPPDHLANLVLQNDKLGVQSGSPGNLQALGKVLVELLRKLPQLHSLNLENNGLSDDLDHMPRFRHLALESANLFRGNNFSNAVQAKIREAFSNAPPATHEGTAFVRAGNFADDICDFWWGHRLNLAAGGYNATDMVRAGCKAEQLKDDYVPKELFDADYPARKMLPGIYPTKELKAAGYLASGLKEAGFSAKELKSGGYSARNLREADYSLRTLKQQGGFSVEELHEAGFSAKELANAGFSLKELHAGGFFAKELREGGFSCKELRGAGFSGQELDEGGFSDDELEDAGFDVR